MKKEYIGLSHFSFQEEEFLEKLLCLCVEYGVQIDSDYGNIEMITQAEDKLLTSATNLSVVKNKKGEFVLSCEVYPDMLVSGQDHFTMTF